MSADAAPEPTFDLDLYLKLPRVAGLVLSPDGRRLVTSVATPSPDGKKFASALWELDPAGEAAPRRLTRSAPGEANAAFLPDGSLLFTSTRPDPEAAPGEEPDEEVARLWLLPAGGGEARPVAATPAGIDLLRVARDAGTVVYRSGVHPGADDLEADERREQARTEAGVSARLFEHYPIRFWDHYLGPREPRLFAAAPPPAGEGRMAPGRPLTPEPGRALDEVDVAVTPDGGTVLAGWDTGEVGNPRTRLVAIDVASGDRRVLLDDPASSAWRIACSPDGRRAVCERVWHGGPDTLPDVSLWLVDLATGEGRDLLEGLDLWPQEPVWAADGRAVFFVADQLGRTPAFRVEVGGEADGRVTRLSADGAFSDLCPGPDGGRLYALRATMAAPAQAVALDPLAADQEPDPLPTPGLPLAVPGSLTEVATAAGDGTRLRGWLVLPATGRRRWWCSSTAGPFRPGRPGAGAGTRGCWPPAATPCCCPTRGCPPATGRRSSAAAGAAGAPSPSPT
jgi:dipeptidyl aminopeptidase/acylaminoacyl peptidase